MIGKGGIILFFGVKKFLLVFDIVFKDVVRWVIVIFGMFVYLFLLVLIKIDLLFILVINVYVINVIIIFFFFRIFYFIIVDEVL